jgi:hypothetical protein
MGIAIVWLRRLARFAREGEIHLVMNASGDGIVGQVLRSERPLLFWIVWSANLALIVSVIALIFIAVIT